MRSLRAAGDSSLSAAAEAPAPAPAPEPVPEPAAAPTPAPAPEPAPAPVTMNQIAEAYVRLVLALGEHDPDTVDAFYGPAAIREEVQRACCLAGHILSGAALDSPACEALLPRLIVLARSPADASWRSVAVRASSRCSCVTTPSSHACWASTSMGVYWRMHALLWV